MRKERIIARLHDGLGNQLFIYAAARSIARARGAELLLDTKSGFARDRKYGAICQVQHFAVKAPFAPESLSYPPPLGRHWRDIQISLSRHLPFRYRFVAREADFEALCDGAPARPLLRLEGYWQSPRYFASIAAEIRDELTVVSPLSDASRAVEEQILATQSVCLHVRQMHGAHHNFDKAPPPELRQLSYAYYEAAIARIAERIESPTFFCFADNFDWIRARWKFPYPIHFVDHNLSREHAYEDIALMSRCRHFVIGNSTFSWWGAWLSRSPDKIVIAPANRGSVVWGSEKDLFPDGWIVLDV